MVIEALVLGLSTGTYCSMYCGPVLIPFLFSAKEPDLKKNAALAGTFLASRLVMYFILGLVLSALGILAGEFFDPVFARKLSSVAYIFCGLSMVVNWRNKCNAKCSVKSTAVKKCGSDFVTAIVCGLSVGLHICPPLWTAMIRSVAEKNFMYMIFFYAGSLPFFIPLLGVPVISKKIPAIRRVAKVALALTGIYFIVFSGILPLFIGYGI